MPDLTVMCSSFVSKKSSFETKRSTFERQRVVYIKVRLKDLFKSSHNYLCFVAAKPVLHGNMTYFTHFINNLFVSGTSYLWNDHLIQEELF